MDLQLYHDCLMIVDAMEVVKSRSRFGFGMCLFNGAHYSANEIGLPDGN